METVTIVLMLLTAVVVSGFVARFIRLPIPLPLVQIAIGAVISFLTPYTVELKPELFFLLFLPPLLFLDGWRIPKQGLFRDASTILELALGLVIVTVVGMGFFINWLIPSMPLAVSFALASVLSPTDPIAVSAIAAKTPIPKRLMHILEGESLLNDASGLVCLRFAIVAATTGVFSVTAAAGTFLQLAIGGVAIGIAVALGITRVKAVLARRFGEETGSQVLISLLIPFAAYLAAEHTHCSGILAAVAAGITMSYAEISGQATAITRIRRTGVWDTIQFAANGVIFILLGEQLPSIMERAAHIVQDTGHLGVWWLGVYIIAINAGLAALRFGWVWASFRLTLFRKKEDKEQQQPSLRLLLVMSFAGVRGAITLAGVLTLPLTMADGTAFPARELAIFLAMGVIITSMIVASVGLPRLLKNIDIPPEHAHLAEEDLARHAAAQAAIRAIEQTQHDLAEGRADADLYTEAAARVMALYRDHIKEENQTDENRRHYHQVEEIERRLHIAGLNAQRNEIYRLTRQRKIEDDVARRLVREIDLTEARYLVS